MMRFTGSLAVLVVLVAVHSADAGFVPKSFVNGVNGVQLFGTDGTMTWDGTMLFNQSNLDRSTGNFSGAWPDQDFTRFSTNDITFGGNVDPTFNVAFTVTNNTLAPQDYTFIFTVPIFPAIVPDSLIGGSTGITITDNNGDGATLGAHSNGRPTYFGQLDGTDAGSINLAPIVEPVAFDSETNSDLFGFPIPSQPAGAVLNSIGIRYDFSLSPGDSAGVTGVFVVVPEPASLALIALGGLLMIKRRSSE